MPANLIDKKHITELAAKAAGLDMKGGNPRLKTIMNRLLSDLFQAILAISALRVRPTS